MSPTYENCSRIKMQGDKHAVQLLTHPVMTLSSRAEMASQGYDSLVSPRLTIRELPWNRHGHQRYSTPQQSRRGEDGRTHKHHCVSRPTVGVRPFSGKTPPI
ncbi:unnamed protein product [Ectocarpus sp. 12 AP-2014]